MHICELPYKNKYKTSLFVLLPGDCPLEYTEEEEDCFNKYDIVNEMYNILNILSTEEIICSHFHKWLKGNVTRETSPNFVVWPNFELEIELPIHQLLQALGVEELVASDGIDMSGFVEGENQKLHLGSAVHRAHVKVTEENTVASAVTALYTGNEFAQPVERVICNSDKPFVWLIYDKHRQNVLFAGAFNKVDESNSYLKREWRKSSYGFF
ncbi:serpin-like protein [Lasius niger]|uniref:Serpin-like protein n=1 Tax=Lasius niger TaxID=67767 RepID=A0A0J7K1E8_LASNI|nr:serpin-like protein [Lasius niger]